MALSSRIFLNCLHSTRQSRLLAEIPVIFLCRGTYSTERTQRLTAVQSNSYTRTGKRKTYLKEKSQILKEARSNPQREVESRKRKLLIPLDKVQEEWTSSQGVAHSIGLARYYGITKDLFAGKDIQISQWMKIMYNQNDAVYKGNKISTHLCTDPPNVSYDHLKDTKYLLLLTNPDGNLENNQKEILHWMISNIPGDNISQGDVVMPYTQPLPWYGSEFHRLVFVLFKQKKDVDVNCHSENKISELATRSFSTQSFINEYSDVIEPTSISWFQCKHDESVASHWQTFSDIHKEPRFRWEEFITSEEITKEERHKLKNNRYRLK